VASNADVPAPATAADVSAKARVREAFAQLPESHGTAAVTQSKAREAKMTAVKPQPKRKIARARIAPSPRPFMLVAQQPHFGLFDTMW
jgi:hypothetical protein